MGVLRFWLAICVVFSHSSFRADTVSFFIPGDVAVEVFFLISGFYMSLVLTTKYVRCVVLL